MLANPDTPEYKNQESILPRPSNWSSESQCSWRNKTDTLESWDFIYGIFMLLAPRQLYDAYYVWRDNSGRINTICIGVNYSDIVRPSCAVASVEVIALGLRWFQACRVKLVTSYTEFYCQSVALPVRTRRKWRPSTVVHLIESSIAY